jgi:hypothetical protein
MSEIETELEDFLQKTQNPSAWLMVAAAKTEIERLNSECDELMALVRRFRLGLGEVES